MEIQTATVTVTQEVKGIFLTAEDIARISYPLYNLVIDVDNDEASSEFARYGEGERKAVRDLKNLIDNFQK